MPATDRLSHLRALFDLRANACRPTLLKHAARLTVANDAEDLCQSVLLHAWLWLIACKPTAADPDARRIADLLERADPEPWQRALLKIQRRIASNRRDYEATHPEFPLPLDTILALSAPALPDQTFAAIEARRRETVMGLLDTANLPAIEEYCVRKTLDGQTQEEIGDFLGVSQPAVSQRLAKAVCRLNAFVDEYVDAEALEVFQEAILEAERAIYHAPGMVWDRDGNAAQVDARRQLKAIEQRERKLNREGR